MGSATPASLTTQTSERYAGGDLAVRARLLASLLAVCAGVVDQVALPLGGKARPLGADAEADCADAAADEEAAGA